MNDDALKAQKEDVWVRLERAVAEGKISREHTEQLLRLNDKLDSEQRKTGRFLIDKFLPILTAILGGIAYVLIDHKAHQAAALNCFRFAGVALTVALLIIFAWTWLEPGIEYQFKENLLNYKFGKPIQELWITKHYDKLEVIRVFAVLFLVISALGTATLGVMLESRHKPPATQNAH